MNRIQKIVARSKDVPVVSNAQQGFDQTAASRHAESEDELLRPESRPRLVVPGQIEYTRTRQIPVSGEVLEAHRVIAQDPSHPEVSRFELLRTRVLQQMRRHKWRSLAVTSVSEGAGRATISANLAISIALEGNQSVLLVDMDLRRPGVHEVFGVKPEWGVIDYLNDQCDIASALFNPGISGVVVLPGGRPIVSTAQTLSRPRVRDMVEELKYRYQDRILIFCLPPALASDDAMIFLPRTDCALMVVEAGRNRRQELEQSVAMLGEHPLLGTVLNKSESPQPLQS